MERWVAAWAAATKGPFDRAAPPSRLSQLCSSSEKMQFAASTAAWRRRQKRPTGVSAPV